MSPLSEIIKGAIVVTSKGAAITLTSTAASCYLACQIESRAHRLIYHYDPTKYAHVEYANGLTQEQLDKASEMMTAMKLDQEKVDSEKAAAMESSSPAADSHTFQFDLSDDGRFWKETTEINPLPRIAEEFVMARQEIIACSMTG